MIFIVVGKMLLVVVIGKNSLELNGDGEEFRFWFWRSFSLKVFVDLIGLVWF